MKLRGDWLPGLGALAAFAAFFAVVFRQALPGNELIAPSDALDFGVAAYLASPALWTDSLYSSYPIAADPQSLTFYPLLQVFRLLGVPWNLFMIAPFVIAGAGTFLLARLLTGSAVAGGAAGLVFAFSGPMLGNLGHFNQLHAVAWAPWALYGLERVRRGASRSGAAVTAMAFALMWLAGHPQIPVYVTYLAGAVVAGGLLIDRPPRTQMASRAGWSLLAVGLGAALAAMMILPMLELGGFSVRAESSWDLYVAKKLPPWQLLSAALPFAFGFEADAGRSVPYFGDGSPGENLAYAGLLPLMLAVAAPWMVARRGEASLWLCLALAAALLAMADATPLGSLFYHVPGAARFRMPTRYLFLMALSVAVGTAFAVEALTRRRPTWPCAASAAGVLVASFGAFAALAASDPRVEQLTRSHALYAGWTLGWPAAIGAATLAALLALRVAPDAARAPAVALLVPAIVAVDLAAVHDRVPGARFEYADVPVEETRPRPRIAELRDELRASGERIVAVDGTHNQFLLPNLTRAWGVPAVGGSGPLAMQRYVDLLRMGGPGDVALEVLVQPHMALDLLGVRYALAPEGGSAARALGSEPARWSRVEAMQFDANDPDSRFVLFRNARAGPRARCVPEIARVPEEVAFDAVRTGRLGDGRAFDPAALALVESELPAGWPATAGTTAGVDGDSAPATVRRTGDRTYEIQTSSPCLLVVGENFYPWWRASVGGQAAGVVRANYAFIGVPVPPGTHLVRLGLAPWSLWAGSALSAAGVVCWVLLVAPGVSGLMKVRGRTATRRDPRSVPV